MDAVWICRSGENEELRYSIRSAEKNLPISNIIVVGSPPEWYTGKSILVPELRNQKYTNAQNNLKAITSSKMISDNFILMNDDFYTIKKIEILPNYNGGSLRQKVERYVKQAPYSTYTRKLMATYRFLIRSGIQNPIDYELHVPMQMDKNGLSKSIYPNLLWRSMYGNRYKNAGHTISDVKVYESKHLVDRSYDFKNGNLPFISSEDASFNLLKSYILGDMFSSPSSVEYSFNPSHGLHTPSSDHWII